MKTELQSMILRPFEEFYAWIRKVAENRSAELREGQFIYNILNESFPEQVKLLGYCGIDCSHDDAMIYYFLRAVAENNLRIAIISDEIIYVFSDYGIKVTIKHVVHSYQFNSFELEFGKRVSKNKIFGAVRDLGERFKYEVRVDFSGCNPVLAVGVPSLPEIIHTKYLHYEPDSEAQLPIILGFKTSDGEVLQFDLAKSGNVLIGGATKQGKTVCIKNMIYCLERCKPKPQIIIFDFKGEYNDYKDRYTVGWDAELLGRIAVETVIGRMNRKEITKFPPLVIIIDDYEELFWPKVCSVDVMIQRSRLPEIAKYGPGVNVHLIISTVLRSFPYKRMYPAELTDNIKTRIAFRVVSRLESKQILGTEGAESLFCRGDGLYAHSDQLVRFQSSCGSCI